MVNTEYLPPENTLIISAVKGNQTAYPFDKAKYGFFSYALMKVMKDTRLENMTYSDLYNKVKKEMQKISSLPNVNLPLQEPDMYQDYCNFKNEIINK